MIYNYKPPVVQQRIINTSSRKENIILLSSSDYLKTTNQAPTMQPMNPNDNTDLNLMSVLNSNNENSNVKSVTTSMFSRIWFYFKIIFICLAIFVILGIGGKRRKKKSEEQGGHEHHWFRYTVIGLFVFWLIDRFFGDDISREVNHLRGDHRQCNHNQQNNYNQQYPNQGYNQQYPNQGYNQNNYNQQYPNQGYNQQNNYNQGYNQNGYNNEVQNNNPPNRHKKR